MIGSKQFAEVVEVFNLVEERSLTIEGYGSENVGLSNEKVSENLTPRKSNVAVVRFVHNGLDIYL